MEFLFLTALTTLLICCLWVLKRSDSEVRAAVAEKEKLRAKLLLARRRIDTLREELKLAKRDIEKLNGDLWLAQERVNTLAIHLSAAVRLGELPTLDLQCQWILEEFESTRRSKLEAGA
jgi:chromosome segregation ATPase